MSHELSSAIRLGDLIAASPQEYVQLAVRAATDREFREFVTGRIVERSDCLFDDQAAVDEHVRFFREAVSGIRGRDAVAAVAHKD